MELFQPVSPAKNISITTLGKHVSSIVYTESSWDFFYPGFEPAISTLFRLELIASFSYEWEVLTVRFVPRGDRAVSKHSDWLSNDFARCDWLNTMSSIPYHDCNSVP